jgi:hypothetical protein
MTPFFRPKSAGQREPVAVGGHHAQLAAGLLEEDAVQVVAGLVGGDRELGELDHREEVLRRHGRELHLVEARQGREVLGREADDAELGGAAHELQVVVLGLLQGGGGLGQRLHDVEQGPGRDRHRALAQHLAVVLRRDRDVEVGGRDVELAALLRLQQHVGEDGHGRLLLDDALRAAEGLGELLDADLQFHGI